MSEQEHSSGVGLEFLAKGEEVSGADAVGATLGFLAGAQASESLSSSRR